MTEKFDKEYFRRFKLIFKSSLNDKNQILAANTWAVSLLRYSEGIIWWTKDELKYMDTKTRKLMIIRGALHPWCDVDINYVPQVKAGGGLISCDRCIVTEENSLGWYIKHSSEFPLQLKTEWNGFEIESSREQEEFKMVWPIFSGYQGWYRWE